jgi:hypothetical protein
MIHECSVRSKRGDKSAAGQGNTTGMRHFAQLLRIVRKRHTHNYSGYGYDTRSLDGHELDGHQLDTHELYVRHKLDIRELNARNLDVRELELEIDDDDDDDVDDVDAVLHAVVDLVAGKRFRRYNDEQPYCARGPVPGTVCTRQCERDHARRLSRSLPPRRSGASQRPGGAR